MVRALYARFSPQDQPGGTASPRPTARIAAVVLAGATLVAALTGAVAYKATEKTVQLSVDGQVRTVSSHFGTVREVLSAAGLTVGAHDLLAPGVDEKVADGSSVALRRGRSLKLTVDGVERTVWVTSPTVDGALLQLGIGDSRSVLSASRSRQIGLNGLSLDVRLAKTVDILADGRPRRLVTTAPTVSALLHEAGVRLRPADKVSVPVTRRPVAGMLVRVIRVDGKRQAENVAIAYATDRRPDSSMYKGLTKVLRAGHPGTLVRTYALTLIDGRLASRVLVSQVKTAVPLTRVLAVGTKSRPAPTPTPTPTVSGADGLNWGALAQCESGGNPQAVSSSGTYRGLYQFSMSTWASVGGSGDPINASSSEQTYRAKVLYNRSGRSSWPVCGSKL